MMTTDHTTVPVSIRMDLVTILMSRRFITLTSVAIALLLWEFFGRQVNPLFGSYPSAIAVAMVELTLSGRLPSAFFQSLQPFVVGFSIAAILGIPIGMLLGRFRFMEAAFGIYVTAGNAMPLIAITPLFMLWFGLGFTVKVAIIATLSFFPICMSTWSGVKSIPKSLIEVGESFVGSRRAILQKIVLPASVPYIMAGIRLAVGKGIIAMIVAEFFTALSGLGGIILTAANNFETAEMFAPIIVLLTFAIMLNAFVQWLEHVIAPWHVQVTGQED
ncbi:ABC transporter permease [Devosia sp.]|uniref:ABC transporter permease n=1 Tax=Devosia sp. TaxID=1871048 RepID=UPI0027340329|nr:ABC transporter permease [Devosia sp.]MDP2778937.1 ABC transporter permease [Devosia sp.]